MIIYHRFDSFSEKEVITVMKIGFIGAGRAGCTLGKYLSDAQVDVAGYYSRTKKSADDAATFTESEAFWDLETLVNKSDTLFVTTPDGTIEEVWKCIRQFDLKDKIICHFSGSLSSGIFSGIEDTGASCCSIHPIYAFSDKFTSYIQFSTACFTIEGQETAVKQMKELFSGKLHHKVFTVKSSDKAKYHAAAAFASNYVVGIMHTAICLLEECGFDKDDAMSLIAPLALNNINSVIKNGTVNALTGPVERNDISTVKKHLDALKDDSVKDIYRSLGRVLISVSEEKNPDTDYTELINSL